MRRRMDAGAAEQDLVDGKIDVAGTGLEISMGGKVDPSDFKVRGGACG